MGLVGLSNVIAVEGAKAGIQSNVLMPVAATRMTEDLLGDFSKQVKPELVTPLVTFLASEACTFTHEMFSAAGGRYARVFIGLAPGWYGGKDHVPTAEDVLDNLAQIENQDGYIVPTASSDELGQLLTLLSS
jgi:NAD(P)-dependent dehydrogenase (short-subunit alcohol dehydrogenase family)